MDRIEAQYKEGNILEDINIQACVAKCQFLQTISYAQAIVEVTTIH